MLNAACICNKTPQWGTAIVGHFVKKSIQLSVNERVLDDTDGTVCAVYISRRYVILQTCFQFIILEKELPK